MTNLPAAISGCCDRRPSVLIDTQSDLDHRPNATTAVAVTSEGRAIEVSFELADPPVVSRCFVHCPGLRKNRFNSDPLILSATDSFMVIGVPFACNAQRRAPASYDSYDLFVYRAGPGSPSLHLIPRPYPRHMDFNMVAVIPLRRHGASYHYAVVIPVRHYADGASSDRYVLHTYRSDSLAWRTKTARISKDAETDHDKLMRHECTRVISVGGGSVALVDLWWGVLLCNALDKDPVLRLIQWPVPLPRNLLSGSRDIDTISARPFRDVAFSNGVIRFVELKFRHRCRCSSNNDGGFFRGWMATTWTRRICSKDWHKGFTVETANISGLLLPEVLKGKRLIWNTVLSAGPTLSLCDDDVVYIMAKLNVQDEVAWVLAINTREGKLQRVAQCSDERMGIGLEPTYVSWAFL